MNTEPTNHETRSTPVPSDEGIGRDTKPMSKFRVLLTYKQYSTGSVIIEAASLDEAEEIADELQSDTIDWDPVDGDMTIDGVEPADFAGEEADND